MGLFICCNVLAIKNGSNPGYFTEWWTLVFILAAAHWDRFREKCKRVSSLVPGGIILVVLLLKVYLLYALISDMTVTSTFSERKRNFMAQKEIANRLAARIGPSASYTIFTNFNTANSFFSNLLFRYAVIPQMDIVGLSTYPRQKYDYSHFTSRLKAGAFRWMIMSVKGPQKQFFEIRLDRYNLKETNIGYNFYETHPAP
jgi:hypothetical protein